MKDARRRHLTQFEGLTFIHRRIASLLARSKLGLTSGEIRARLKLPPGTQSQLDRRRRELRTWYFMKTVRNGNVYRFSILRPRKKPLSKPAISARLRARILHEAQGQCGMCGRLIGKHRIRLHLDHRVPKSWGGTNDVENLWCLCSDCNQGKKAFFSSAKSSEMRKVMKGDTSHERIARLLRLHPGKPVPSHLLQIAGNEVDWRKRLRELRYLGWNIQHQRHQVAQRTSITYTAVTVGRHGPGMTAEIRKIERQRTAKRKSDS